MAFDFQLRVRYVLKIKILIAICHLSSFVLVFKGEKPLDKELITPTTWVHNGKDI